MVLSALVPALVTYFRGENRRTRSRNRALEVAFDERDDRLMAHRAEIRVHNDEYHPNGVGALPLPPLPEHMTRADDDE